MLDVGITTNIKDVIKDLNKLQREQLPKIYSEALNQTAEDIRKEELRNLGKKFVLRGEWWKPKTKFGINIKLSTPQSLEAHVFTRAPWMHPHDEGKTKKPQKSGFLAIPSRNIRKSPGDKITRAKWPKNLKRTFLIEGSKGPVLMRRTSKRRAKPMYFLEKAVKIKPTLNFHAVGERVFQNSFRKNFKRALDNVLRGWG